MTGGWQRGRVAVPTEVTVAKKPAGQWVRHPKKGTLGGRRHRLGRLGFEKAPRSSSHKAMGIQWSPRGDGRLQERKSQGKSCGFGAGRARGLPRDGRCVTLRGPLWLGSPCAHLSLSARNSNMRKGRKGRKERGPECCPPVLTQSPGGSMQRGGEHCVKPPPRMVTKPCGCQPTVRGSLDAVPSCSRCGKETGEEPRTPRVAPAVQGGTPSSSKPSSLPCPSKPHSPNCITTAPTSRLLAI